MVLKLYKLDLSSPACAAMMICEIHQVPVELIDVDVLAGETRTPEYLNKNPMHTIPMLEDDDLILHESHVILTYLTEKYGKDDTLYPKDITKKALVDQKLYYDVLLFNRTKNITYAAMFEGVTKLTDKIVEPLEEAIGFLESFLSKTKFVAGDDLTVADVSICASMATARYLVSLDKFPKVKAWFSYMEQQPYFQKIVAPGSAIVLQTLKQKLNL